MSLSESQIKNILEAALLTAGQPMNIDKLITLFGETPPERDAIRQALNVLADDCAARGIELKEVASGFRYQAKQETAEWVSRLWEEKPPRYSRAVLETLVLIAYRQPITRGEIEHVRGVSVSSHIIKTLLERDWVKVVGHRDVPGRPAIYATTRAFLDYFNLKSLDQLPTLAEIRDLDKIRQQLELQEGVLDQEGDDKFAPDEGVDSADDSAQVSTFAANAGDKTAADDSVNNASAEVQYDVEIAQQVLHAEDTNVESVTANDEELPVEDSIGMSGEQHEAEELAILEEAILTEEMVNADGDEYEHVASGDDLDSLLDNDMDQPPEVQDYESEQEDDNRRSMSAVE